MPTRQSCSSGRLLLGSITWISVTLVSLLVLIPAMSASEVAIESTESLHEAIAADDPSVCAEPLGLDTIAPMICTYCDQEYCGCITIEGCALEYSCTCSPLQCTRSCRIVYCVP